MFVVKAFGVRGGTYNTDPYCVWREGKGFARWPHEFDPTHWMPLPAAPGRPANAKPVPPETLSGAKERDRQDDLQHALKLLRSLLLARGELPPAETIRQTVGDAINLLRCLVSCEPQGSDRHEQVCGGDL